MMSARAAAVVLALIVMTSCAHDPDAAARDSARDKARAVAQTIAMPPGYQLTTITDDPAQTPQENRGGGQAGQINIEFRTSHKTNGEVLRDLDAAFAPRSLRVIKFGGTEPQCTDKILTVALGDDTYILEINFYPDRQTGLMRIPYSWNGPMTANLYKSPSDVPLPKCAS